MTGKLVFTVGNDMMGDDAAGPLLARMLEDAPLEGWAVLNGGSAPENAMFKVREMRPEHVLIVDAADMNLSAGDVQVIDKEQIASLFLMTTHSLPLSFLMDAISEFAPHVEMIGIQPGTVAFGYPVSQEVRSAVERIYDWLEQHEERGSVELAAAITAQDQAERSSR